jgi:predicted nucleic acid-binding protein
MMVLVDTTVWIDFFAARSLSHVKAFEDLITDKQDICSCGVILTEVLQGIRQDSEYEKTKDLLENLIFLPMVYATFVRSADMCRMLRRKGITIKKPLDCMIASVALENGVPLLHNDKDFRPIERHCGLRVFP